MKLKSADSLSVKNSSKSRRVRSMVKSFLCRGCNREPVSKPDSICDLCIETLYDPKPSPGRYRSEEDTK